MALLISTVILYIIVSLFYLYGKPVKRIKHGSIIFKEICALIFILVAVFSALRTGSFDRYAVLVIIGSCFGGIADFFMDLPHKKVYYLTGVSGFFAGHICYISALWGKISDTKGGSFFPFPFVIAAVLFIGYAIAYNKFKSKIRMGHGEIIPIAVYSVTLTSMALFALTASVFGLIKGVPYALPFALCLSVGSLLFLVSDSILSFKMYTDLFKGKLPRAVMLTYLPAQLLIALSINFA